MKNIVLKVHEKDNVIVALTDLKAGSTISFESHEYTLVDDIAAKHKFYTEDMHAGGEIIMYLSLIHI